MLCLTFGLYRSDFVISESVMACFFYCCRILTARLLITDYCSIISFNQRMYRVASCYSTVSAEELTKLESALKPRQNAELYHRTIDHEFARQSHTRTIVLLGGWIDSKLQTLVRKYASIYANEFHLPCLCVAPPMHLVWSTKLGLSFTDGILQALNNSLDPQRQTSLILHLFSGAGTVLFPRLLQERNDTESSLNSKLKLSGIIFDSGPALYSSKSAKRGAKLDYDHGGLNPFKYYFYTNIGIPLSDLLVGEKIRRELHKALDSDLLDVPQLYFYSKKDSVSPHQWVEEVIRGQRVKGREVSSHCWEDSQHVQHLKQHKQQYTELVRKFLKHYV